MEEMSKIKYSIGELIKKRNGIQMKDSIEAKFAQTLNRIVSSENEQNPLMAKLGAHIGLKTQEKVSEEVR